MVNPWPTIAERLTTLSHPDRAADIAIFGAMWPDVTDHAQYVNWRFMKSKGAYITPELRTDFLRARAPLYTTDIPAALLLVPDGWEWQLSNRAKPPHAGRAYIHNRELLFAGIGGTIRNPKYRGHEITAYTVPIALCIVCALAQVEPTHG